MLKPAPRRSLADDVFAQLRAAILRGDLPAGEDLPGERQLCETFEVSRPALREALARLAQAGLLHVRHGGRTRVAQWKDTAGLDLLPALFDESAGGPGPELLLAALEMRAALAPDVARKCAERAPERGDELRSLADAVAEEHDLVALRRINVQFWTVLIEGSGNLAYRLAYNSLTRAVDPREELVAAALAPELTNVGGFVAVADAVSAGDGEAAARAAAALIAPR